MASGREDSDEWYLPLEALGHSALMAWPCRLTNASDNGDAYLVPRRDLRQVELVTITSLEHVVARKIIWRSPLYQARMFGKHFEKTAFALRMFTEGGTTTVLQIAARSAFCNLQKSHLDTLASWLGLPPAHTLFDRVLQLVMRCGNWSEADALDLASRRLGAQHADALHAAAPSCADEAIEVLDQRDHFQVKGAVKAAEAARAERDMFAGELRAKRRVVDAQRDKKKRARTTRGAPKARQPIPNNISQATSKSYIPLAHPCGGLARGTLGAPMFRRELASPNHGRGTEQMPSRFSAFWSACGANGAN